MGIPLPPGMGNRGGSQIYRENKKGEQMINEEQKRDIEQYLSTNELMEMLGISINSFCCLWELPRVKDYIYLAPRLLPSVARSGHHSTRISWLAMSEH